MEEGYEETRYMCHLCEETFCSKYKLNAHQHIHNETHKCDECGSCFRNTKELKRHMWIHKEERPFKCETCLKTFRSKSSLKNHQLVHVKDKKIGKIFLNKLDNFTKQEGEKDVRPYR